MRTVSLHRGTNLSSGTLVRKFDWGKSISLKPKKPLEYHELRFRITQSQTNLIAVCHPGADTTFSKEEETALAEYAHCLKDFRVPWSPPDLRMVAKMYLHKIRRKEAIWVKSSIQRHDLTTPKAIKEMLTVIVHL